MGGASYAPDARRAILKRFMPRHRLRHMSRLRVTRLATRHELPPETAIPRTDREIRDRIAANIDLAHDRSGLTVGHVARQLEVDRSRVSRWRRGLNRPDLEHLEELAVIYGVTLGWFFDEHAAEDLDRAAA